MATETRLITDVKQIKKLESDGNILDAVVHRVEHSARVRKLYGGSSSDAKDSNLELAERLLEFGASSVALDLLLDAAESFLGQSRVALETIPLSAEVDDIKPALLMNPVNTHEELVQEAKPGTSFTFPPKGLRMQQIRLLILLGWAFESCQRFRHSVYYYRQALELIQRVYGPHHMDNLQVYEGLARVYMQLEHFPEALKAVMREKELLVKLRSQKTKTQRDQLDDQLIACSVIAANLFQRLGDSQSALDQFMKDVRPQQEDKLGSDDPRTQQTYYRIAELYIALKRYGDAVKVLAKIRKPAEGFRDKVIYLRDLASVLREAHPQGVDREDIIALRREVIEEPKRVAPTTKQRSRSVERSSRASIPGLRTSVANKGSTKGTWK